LLSENILIIASTSLTVEVVAFVLLLYGYSQTRARRYRQHGIAMTGAVASHLVVIFSWMIFSLVSFFSAVPLDLGNIWHVATLVHVTLGALAASLGVWLVGSWRLRADLQKCFGRKRFMLTTIAAWSGALLLGIFFYIVLVMS
jgi:uncharacterized membrane protein YozB (DUF420 family)